MPKGVYKRKNPIWNKGLKGWTNNGSFKLGHTTSKPIKIKIAKSLKGIKRSIVFRRKQSKIRKGEKSPLWKGGVTKKNFLIRSEIEFRLWREAVFARDNWTCQKTGERGGKLHAHHIQNFSQFLELRFAIDNGITFSDKAHIEFHKKYGRKNNTKEQLEEFLAN